MLYVWHYDNISEVFINIHLLIIINYNLSKCA